MFMAGDMIRVWNEPVVADFNAFYLILSGGTEEDHKSLNYPLSGNSSKQRYFRDAKRVLILCTRS
jgi:hypothetical protein